VERTHAAAIKLATLALAAFALTLLLSQPAAAAFKVFPTIVDVQRNAGRAALGTIDVRLKGERGERFRTVVEEIGQRPDGTQTYAPASNAPYSASSWVRVTPATFAGAPDRVQPIQYQVVVPVNAEPGDHLASLTVQRLAKGGDATAAAINAVSVRLTIRVGGPLDPAARITELDVPGIADGGPVGVSATVENSGNLTLDFDHANRGGVKILDGDDRKAALPFEGKLFPGQTRVFASRWEDPPLLGHFEALASVRTTGEDAHRSARFWVIPWRQIGALLLLLVAVVLLALGIRRRRWGY
jgi:hypothetical protein